MSEKQNLGDQDAGKGAVEGGPTNTSMRGQNPHRNAPAVVKANDSDFPEPGNNPEHSGERRIQSGNSSGLKKAGADRDREGEPAEGADIKAGRSPERDPVNQDPGHKQKRTHNDEKDDPLAA